MAKKFKFTPYGYKEIFPGKTKRQIAESLKDRLFYVDGEVEGEPHVFYLMDWKELNAWFRNSDNADDYADIVEYLNDTLSSGIWIVEDLSDPKESLVEWLDTVVGCVESYDDVLSYIPAEWDRTDPDNPYHIWRDEKGIHCDTETDAEIVRTWLEDTVRGYEPGMAWKTYDGGWLVWFEGKDDEEGGDEE